MGNTQSLKEYLIHTIQNLPEDCISEILDFTQFIIQRQKRKQAVKSADITPKENPLLKYIGGVDIENLASNIDKDLYDNFC